MQPDIMATIYFKKSDENGRKTDIEGDVYACPLIVNGKAFDCRVLLNGKRIYLGETYELEIKFLNANAALEELIQNPEIILWEGKDIAMGTVIKFLNKI